MSHELLAKVTEHLIGPRARRLCLLLQSVLLHKYIDLVLADSCIRRFLESRAMLDFVVRRARIVLHVLRSKEAVLSEAPLLPIRTLLVRCRLLNSDGVWKSVHAWAWQLALLVAHVFLIVDLHTD